MKFKVVSFYTYTEIENPERLMDEIRELCKSLNILGRILIGKEGINCAASGEFDSIEKFKEKSKEIFPALTFREQECEENSYHKLIVRIRKDIIAFGKNVDLSKRGKHIKPIELKKILDRKDDFVLLDARNDYETKVGKFEGAVELPIQNFRDFPNGIKTANIPKDKKIVMYCTGGIRCEKASAFLKQQGFDKVYQLEGGIINFVNQYNEGYWKGGLFVFDDRRVSSLAEPISECEICKKKSHEYINCFNLDCDKLFISCKSCQESLMNTCSEACKNSPRQRKPQEKSKVVGIVENYYAKNKVALVKVYGRLSKNSNVKIIGKTTNFDQKVTEIRRHDNKITIPVCERVRKNDVLIIK